jgi:hypothetical protein
MGRAAVGTEELTRIHSGAALLWNINSYVKISADSMDETRIISFNLDRKNTFLKNILEIELHKTPKF